jgi:hypothetical protein
MGPQDLNTTPPPNPYYGPCELQGVRLTEITSREHGYRGEGYRSQRPWPRISQPPPPGPPPRPPRHSHALMGHGTSRPGDLLLAHPWRMEPRDLLVVHAALAGMRSPHRRGMSTVRVGKGYEENGK